MKTLTRACIALTLSLIVHPAHAVLTITNATVTRTTDGGVVNFKQLTFTPADTGENGLYSNASCIGPIAINCPAANQLAARVNSGVTNKNQLLVVFPGGGQVGETFCAGENDGLNQDF